MASTRVRVATAGLLGVLAIAGTAIVTTMPLTAQEEGRNQGIPSQDIPDDPKTAGGDRWAVVDGNAKLARGKGVDSVKFGKAVGDYVVTFDKNVRQCVFEATIGLSDHKGVSPPGFITVVGDNNNSRAVYVSTYDVNARSAKRSFHLLVGCD